MCHAQHWKMNIDKTSIYIYDILVIKTGKANVPRLGQSTYWTPMRCLLVCGARDGPRALCTAGKCSATEHHLGSSLSARRRLQLSRYTWSSLHPASYGVIFFPLPFLKKNAQRQFYWTLREKHNIGEDPGRRQEETEESHGFKFGKA